MLADAIKDCTRRGDLVLDPFAGSGSTLLAADRTGRRGYGVEIEPRYVDVALRRLEAITGCDAIHLESGLTWRQLATERGIDPEPARGRSRQRRTRS
jgi:DNA modification methylase